MPPYHHITRSVAHHVISQVVEVADFNRHLVEECDQSQPFRYDPPVGVDGFTGCPLCLNELPATDEGLRQHMCVECPANPRIQPQR
jgi:hypothetical protein